MVHPFGRHEKSMIWLSVEFIYSRRFLYLPTDDLGPKGSRNKDVPGTRVLFNRGTCLRFQWAGDDRKSCLLRVRIGRSAMDSIEV